MAILLLLDADVLIDLERERPSAIQWVATLGESPFVSGIAAGELMYGCRTAREIRKARIFLEAFPILWPEPEDVRVAVESLAAYKLSHGIGFLDAITASIAVRHDLPLATFNAKHFQPIPNLQLATPYVR